MLREYGQEMGAELIHKRGGVSRIMTNMGPRGGLPMYINSTHFPKFANCI
jgi:hypothetical protein